MKTIATAALTVTFALTACDPYTAENTGQGKILSVFTSSQTIATVDGTQAASGAWTVSGAASVTAASGVVSWPVTWVRFDKLLDGYSIQATAIGCVPAAGLGLSVTESTAGYTLPLCAATDERAGLAPAWYACYVPNTAVSTEGAGVVFYLGCNDISSTGTGWNDNSLMQNGARYRIVASVKDKQARSYPLDITVETVPAATTLTLGTATAASQPMTWLAEPGDASYDVERAPNVPAGTPPADAAGAYAALVGATGLTAASYTDATVATGTKYWYRIRTHAANGLAQVSDGAEATIP